MKRTTAAAAVDNRVPIAGLQEWIVDNEAAEAERRRRFSQRVRDREQLIRRAILKRTAPIPTPLLCAGCAVSLTSRMHGIETPAGRLKCAHCRVGVKA